MKLISIARLLGALAVVLFIASCGGGGSGATPAAPASISVQGLQPTIDSSVPAAATAAIKNYVTPVDLQAANATIQLPVSSAGGESMVYAVDANNNIILAALTTSASATLSANTTALALVRLSLGALPASTSVSQLNSAIEATAAYQALVSAISTALAAGNSPSTQSAVFNAILNVLFQIPTSALPVAAAERRSMAVEANLGTSATVPPYTLYAMPTLLGQSTGSVIITDATDTGGVTLANSTAITWSLSSASTGGTSITCASPGASSSSINPDCSIQINATNLQNNIFSSPSTATVPGNGDAFNLTLEQNAISRTANVLQIGEDAFSVFVAWYTAGAASPLVSCINGAVGFLLPPAQVAALVRDTSFSTVMAYINTVGTWTNVRNAISNSSDCANIGVVQPPTGSNPVGPGNFIGSSLQFLTGFANFLKNGLLGGIVGQAQAALTAGGIPLQIAEIAITWSVQPTATLVCEAQGPATAQLAAGLQVEDCAGSFQFTPSSLSFFTFGGTQTPTSTAMSVYSSTTPTLWPPDVVYTISAPSSVAMVNPNNGAVTVLAGAAPTTTPITVTATDQSTGVTGTYTVSIVQATPTVTVSANPTTVSTGGTTALSVTVAPPSSAPAGAPTPTQTVSFADTNGALICAETSSSSVTLNSPGAATCTVTITSTATSDTITATYSGDTNYAAASGTTTITIGGCTVQSGGGSPNIDSSTGFSVGANSCLQVTGYEVLDLTSTGCAANVAFVINQAGATIPSQGCYVLYNPPSSANYPNWITVTSSSPYFDSTGFIVLVDYTITVGSPPPGTTTSLYPIGDFFFYPAGTTTEVYTNVDVSAP